MDYKKNRTLDHFRMSESEKSKNEKHHHRGRTSESHLNRDIVLKALDIRSGQTILDAGCGSGYMSKEFSKIMNSTGRVYALDPDEAAIEILKQEIKGTNIEPLVADITKKTPLNDSSVDLIYLSTVFHGFSEEEIAGFQQEVKRLLKPNAVLAIVEFQKIKTPFGPPLGIRYSPEELNKTMTLNLKTFMEVGEYFYMQIFENVDG